MSTVEQRLLEVADTSPETLQAVLEEHGWGDGLPVVPPTEDRVERMLARAVGDPDEELGLLFPRAGVITPASRRSTPSSQAARRRRSRSSSPRAARSPRPSSTCAG